jgi:hypothetical protein
MPTFVICNFLEATTETLGSILQNVVIPKDLGYSAHYDVEVRYSVCLDQNTKFTNETRFVVWRGHVGGQGDGKNPEKRRIMR